MTGVINSSSFAKLLWPGLNKVYGMSYEEYPLELKQLFDTYTSQKKWEEDLGTSTFGLFVEKTEGSPITFDSAAQGFTTRYTHTVYASGFIITREMKDDDQYAVMGELQTKELARSGRQTQEILAASIYNRHSSVNTYGDGQYLLSASRPNRAGGTWSNTIGTAADISEAALEQAVIDIAGFTNDRGNLIAVRPKTLIVPYQSQFEVERILKSVGRIDTANNDLNALKSMGVFKNVVISHYITDSDSWFIRTDVPNGMKYFERDPMEFSVDNDGDTENAKFRARFRASWGMSDPRGIYGSPGA